jgi:hypothetical protein
MITLSLITTLRFGLLIKRVALFTTQLIFTTKQKPQQIAGAGIGG